MPFARTRRQASWAPVVPLVGLCTVLLTDSRCAVAAPPAADKAGTPSGDDQTLPRGIDIGKLDEFERKVFFRVVNRESSACGKGHSLLHSARFDESCRASFYAVRYVAHLVDTGFTDSEIGEKLEKRFRTPRVPRFDLAAAPSKGVSGAGRLTLVEFVDYECPHCRHAQALLRQIIEDYPKDVRLFFKHFPLTAHTNARLAAEGAVAAHKQGKFWAFNEKVWAQSDTLTPALLEQIAKEVGLDVARWRKDADSDAVKERVNDDRSEGSDLGITGTPTLYIHGRKYTDPLEIASLKDWVDEELGR
jgi:thiol-disulfide isomerase/thioredoxin